MTAARDLLIRAEETANHLAIRQLVVNAFGRSAEADLLNDLRHDGDMAFAGVALRNGAVIGHVGFSQMKAPFPALGLGPLAVAEPHRKAGVGSALVRWGLARAAKDRSRAVFVLGDPQFYGRFGFDAARAAGFSSPYAGPHFMALALGGDLPAREGRVDYAPAFGALDDEF